MRLHTGRQYLQAYPADTLEMSINLKMIPGIKSARILSEGCHIV